MRLLTRIFIPEIAKAMQGEGGFGLSNDNTPRDKAYSNYFQVVENRSEMTKTYLASSAAISFVASVVRRTVTRYCGAREAQPEPVLAEAKG